MNGWPVWPKRAVDNNVTMQCYGPEYRRVGRHGDARQYGLRAANDR
jgi:hypothetical protein